VITDRLGLEKTHSGAGEYDPVSEAGRRAEGADVVSIQDGDAEPQASPPSQAKVAQLVHDDCIGLELANPVAERPDFAQAGVPGGSHSYLHPRSDKAFGHGTLAGVGAHLVAAGGESSADLSQAHARPAPAARGGEERYPEKPTHSLPLARRSKSHRWAYLRKAVHPPSTEVTNPKRPSRQPPCSR
jgi:hypothetical protein